MVELTIDKVDPKDTNRLRIVKYLSDRTLADEALEEACKKEYKTLDGVLNYVFQEAKKVAVSGKAWIDDDTVFNWVTHYIIEDEIDCEPKKEEPKPVGSATSFYEQWKKDHPTPSEPPKKPKAQVVQLVFDF